MTHAIDCSCLGAAEQRQRQEKAEMTATPKECGKCGRVATDKNIRSFVQDLWASPPIWRCNDLVACANRVKRMKEKVVMRRPAHGKLS